MEHLSKSEAAATRETAMAVRLADIAVPSGTVRIEDVEDEGP
ncbi:hypothetical protein [Streptomyces justiciae]|nr:hypothetical protein [Streptomyces justiciae]MCW8382385.1 hypothetical protein [Streptomyces justiciae]